MHQVLVAPCGILFPDQGSNLGLHSESTKSYPLGHQRTTELRSLEFTSSVCLVHSWSLRNGANEVSFNHGAGSFEGTHLRHT